MRTSREEKVIASKAMTFSTLPIGRDTFSLATGDETDRIANA